MSASVILNVSERVRVSVDAADWYSNEMLNADSEKEFTVVDFDGTYGSKKPVRVTLADDEGNEYFVPSSSIVQHWA